jgi:hypothetical protein
MFNTEDLTFREQALNHELGYPIVYVILVPHSLVDQHLAFILERAQDMSQVMSLNYLDITYQA